MFAGHGLLAFALVAASARYLGRGPRAALYAGLLAGLFATLPDLDILYGPVGLLGGTSGVFDAAEAFWATGNVVHRGPTHSLVVSAGVAGGAALWRVGRIPARSLAVVLLGTTVAVVTSASGGLAGLITALYAGGAVGIAMFARRLGLGSRTVLATAVAGTFSHPFGDLFTGEPPVFLYPLDVVLIADRVVLHPDPTLHLLAAFAVELATVWLALWVYFWLTEWRIADHVDRRAAVGVAYAAAPFVLPAPTLATSYHFVFTVLGIGIVGLTPASYNRLRWRQTAATVLATVTVAWAAYTLAYLVVG